EIANFDNTEFDDLLVDELSVENNIDQDQQIITLQADESAIDPLTDDLIDENETAEEVTAEDLFNTVVDNDGEQHDEYTDVQQAVELLDVVTDSESESAEVELDNVSHADLSVDSIELDESVLQEIDRTPLAETDQLEDERIIESSPAVTGLNENQQELVDLVRSELAEIIDERDELLNILDNTQDIETQIHHLMNISEQAENISNAVRLIGLEGMAECAVQISLNVKLLAQQNIVLTGEQKQLVYDWPVYMLGMLQNIYASKPAEALVEFLSSDHWQQPLSSDRQQQILENLQHPDFVEEEVEQRQQVAEPDDVTLQLPDDVNMELLEGLLQDLPSQTEEFSASLQSLAETGDVSQLDVAQRIAHTLKGAANVVGVKGIANLTHHLEDILQVLTKAGKIPAAELQNVLVTASDCLEAMSETLLGIDVAPENAQQVLQDVLDWANRLDKEGLKDEYTEVLGSSVRPGQGQISEIEGAPKEKESISAENMLRIPTRLADDMLRLAGENLISNVQVQAHIRNTLDRHDALKLHNHSLQQLSSDLEHLIDIQGITSNLNVTDDDEFDPLEMDQYHELHSVSRRLLEITADSIQHANVLEQELLDLKNLIIAQDQLHKENQELVLRTRMVPIKTITPRLKRGVRQACRLTGKKVDLTVIDNDTSMDSEVLNGLIEPLMHLLRNAVDHGIESVAERQQLHKPETGQILLGFTRKGEQIVISVRDDGRGLDQEQIRMRAVENQLITGDHEMLPDEINRLILEPGFTTRQGVTHVSGRGIGLDVVNVKIRDLKGSITIESNKGHGCNFELTLPISSFSTHSLLVRVREFVYAISSRGIEEILYPGAGEISDIGDETVYQLGDQTYRTLLIDSVLGLPHDRRRIERQSRPIILVQEESGAKTAIMVQEVISSIDVVVKPMGHYLPKVKGIVGATVLGDGSVAPVVDLPEMLFELAYRQFGEDDDNAASFMPTRLPYVLVVDDSLSARRSLAQFVEDLGLEVRTARDGMEAVSLIEVRKPDLILVDMEMPKMNGLELTSHVRASDNIKNLPIIMITSRSTDKHRKTAQEKGVNHFMVKPFAEDELAGHIHSLLEAV
ncbi:MAG: response regulator, partial [Gammaproteobacteria bacterium]|nr:response regulator [Gammaproteobacteria bacterium]